MDCYRYFSSCLGNDDEGDEDDSKYIFNESDEIGKYYEEKSFKRYSVLINAENDISPDDIKIEFNFNITNDDAPSVDDDDYYDHYTSDLCDWNMNINSNIIIMLKMLEIARTEANRNIGCMTLETLKDISLCYEKTIAILPFDHRYILLRRKLIREYDIVRNKFKDFFTGDEAHIQSLLQDARSSHIPLEERKVCFRGAIKLTSDMSKKNNIKREYNNFLVSTPRSSTITFDSLSSSDGSGRNEEEY
jgi:hypothetical protein